MLFINHHMNHIVSFKNLNKSLNQNTIANPLHENDGFESTQNNVDFSGFGFRLGIRFDL